MFYSTAWKILKRTCSEAYHKAKKKELFFQLNLETDAYENYSSGHSQFEKVDEHQYKVFANFVFQEP